MLLKMVKYLFSYLPQSYKKKFTKIGRAVSENFDHKYIEILICSLKLDSDSLFTSRVCLKCSCSFSFCRNIFINRISEKNITALSKLDEKVKKLNSKP